MRVANKQFGVSLVEMVITVAVLAVLTTIAVPSYKQMIQNNKIRNASESIQSGIQIARAEAVKRNVPVQFDLRGGNSAWTVCVSPAVPGPCPNPDDATTIQSRGVSEGSSTDVTVVASRAAPYQFSVLGVLTGGAVSFDVDNTALTAAESRDLRILVATGGGVRVCDPALSATGSDPRRCP